MYSFVFEKEIKYYEYYYICNKEGKRIRSKNDFCFCIDRLRKVITFINAQDIEDVIDINKLLNTLLDIRKVLEIQGYSIDNGNFPYYINNELVNLLGAKQI